MAAPSVIRGLQALQPGPHRHKAVNVCTTPRHLTLRRIVNTKNLIGSMYVGIAIGIVKGLKHV